jgi:hypothetical protein
VSSPPPPHNFDTIPEVAHGPHELGNPFARARLGRDWLAQSDAADVLAPPSPEARVGEAEGGAPPAAETESGGPEDAA